MFAHADRNGAVVHLALTNHRLGQRLGVGADNQVTAVKIANGIQCRCALHRSSRVLLPELNRTLVGRGQEHNSLSVK